jgi:uncharacterized membrane protein
VGIADNGQEDPLSGGPQLHGVLWQGGTMTDLGALFGGYDTWALSVNSRGEIAGEAYNTIPDADSMFGYGYQSRAFYWNNGVAQDLGTLGATDRMRKQSARQISDFGSAAARQWQCLQPGFDIHGLHFGQTVGPPPGQNPFVEIDASRFAAKRAPVLPQPHAGP